MIYVFTLDSLSCIARYRPMLEFALSFAFSLIRSLSFTHLASLALRNLQLDCLGRSFLWPINWLPASFFSSSKQLSCRFIVLRDAI